MIEEVVPAHENRYREKLIEMLRAKMVRENPKTMHRDAHPKQHGLVRGRFSVAADLPAHLRVGLFASSEDYDCWIRFSNQNAPPQADSVKDIRGAAIKIMSVPGEKIDIDDHNQTSQDFITISTPVFVTHDVKEFFQLIKALVTGKLAILWYFLWHPRTAINLLKSNRCYYSPLEARYWSTTPYQFGPDHVVKYSLIPQNTTVHEVSSPPHDDYMRLNMVKQLAETEYCFDFSIQMQTDPQTMPVEDPGKRWNETTSPFIKVATVTIAKQAFDNDAQNQYGRDLSFNPWHCLPAHKPLGGINRARRVIYNELSRFRHDKNNIKRSEPTHFEIPQQ